MSYASRRMALAAIAEASGRPNDPAVADGTDAGVITLESPGFAKLTLLEGDIISSAGIWHFDDAPAGPPDAVPTWRGYLVRVAGTETEVVRLGDRPALVEAWPRLAEWLSPFELASLIARYFGRDAGLAVHHTVIESRRDAERLLADPADLPEKVAPARVSEPRPADDLVTLSFFSSFIEPGPEGEPAIGLCYWKARWAPTTPLAWDSLVIARRLPSGFAP